MLPSPRSYQIGPTLTHERDQGADLVPCPPDQNLNSPIYMFHTRVNLYRRQSMMRSLARALGCKLLAGFVIETTWPKIVILAT